MDILRLRDEVLSKLGEPNAVFGPELEAAMPTILDKFSNMVASNPDIRELLKREYTVTVTSGIGDLSPAFTETRHLIIEHLHCANFYITGGTTPMQPLPDRTQLGLERSRMVIWYVVDGDVLRTRNTDGQLNTLNTTVTIKGNYTAQLSDIPAQIEGLFVDFVCDYIRPTQG